MISSRATSTARRGGRAIESLSFAVHEVGDPHVADVLRPCEVDVSSVGGELVVG